MPNAQTHLAAAEALLNQPTTRQAAPWLAETSQRAAYLLGAISPDVRGISGHTREETHFFTIPSDPDQLAEQVMLAKWPQIADKSSVKRQQAAFIAGYMTHLIMDQIWVDEVVMQGLFLEGSEWGIHHPNWRLYAILMVYMEYEAVRLMPGSVVNDLQSASPDHWMPFIADDHLIKWRDRISMVIRQGGARMISTPLAQTCNMGIDEMEAIVLSDERMEDEAFIHLPRQRLQSFEAKTAARSMDSVLNYLGGIQ